MIKKDLTVLIIEDNQTIAAQIGTFLSAKCWQVDYAHNGHLGVSLVLNKEFDLIILDLGLPDLDGFEVCEQIKSQSPVNIPILILTARDAFEDKAKGFHLGADDYITKPFDFRELLLRCEALTRRNSLYQEKLLNIGNLTLDLNEQKVTKEGRKLTLNSTAFTILLLLVKAYPRPVSRSMLVHQLWGNEPPSSDSLKSHIYNLRVGLNDKFESSKEVSPTIKTMTNIGYKLEFKTL